MSDDGANSDSEGACVFTGDIVVIRDYNRYHGPWMERTGGACLSWWNAIGKSWDATWISLREWEIIREEEAYQTARQDVYSSRSELQVDEYNLICNIYFKH